jgi:O-antigen/teichoic acid export membrane protein
MGIIIRQSIKGTLVNYAGTFIGFLATMFVATRWLSGEEIGLARVLVEAATLLSYFAQLGVTSSAIRFYPRLREKPGGGGFFYYLVTIPLVGSLLFIPLFLLFRAPVVEYFQERSGLFVDYIDWIIPLALFIIYIGVFEVHANLLMRIVIPRFIREVVIRVLVVGVYLLYGFRYIDLAGFVAGHVIVHGAAMALNLWYLSRVTPLTLRHDPAAISHETRRDFFKYSAYLMAGVIGGGITARLDLFMVSGMIGLGSGGVYSIAFYMAAIIEIPSRSITAMATPVAASALQAGDFARANALYKKVSLHQLMIGGFIFLLLWINIDNVYDIIPNGDTFRAGKWVVFHVALSRLIVLFLGFGYTLVSFSRYYHWTLYFTFLVTPLTLLANYLLIPLLGITGSALATLLTVAVTHATQQWLVFAKLGGNPYTWATLKFLLLLGGLFAFNLVVPALGNPWVDAIARSAIVGGTGVVVLHFLHLSPEWEQVTRQALRFLRPRRH